MAAAVARPSVGETTPERTRGRVAIESVTRRFEFQDGWQNHGAQNHEPPRGLLESVIPADSCSRLHDFVTHNFVLLPDRLPRE